jgi:hypothetical protein
VSITQPVDPFVTIMNYGEGVCVVDITQPGDSVVTILHYDEGDDKLVCERVQDVEPILESNKALQNDGTAGYSPSKDLRRIASIPLILVEKWLREEGINVFDRNHWPAVRNKLNSPEYSYLRTSKWRV